MDLLHRLNSNKQELPLKADLRQKLKQVFPGGVIKEQKQDLHVHGRQVPNQIQVNEGLP
jgi:hypothetical protein